MSEEKYADYIEAVIKECPDAAPAEVAEAFAKYEQEFYIPPQDAMRSVLRRFKSGTSIQGPRVQMGSGRPILPTSRSSVRVGSTYPPCSTITRASSLAGSSAPPCVPGI